MTADFSPAAPKPSSDRPIAAVQKALDVLDVLVFEDPNRCGLRPAELAARLNQKPATLRGILKTMIACGYVEQDAHARYRTGKRCEQIGALNRLRLRPNLGRNLNARLQALCDETGESVSFYVLSGGERICFLNLQTRDIIKVDYSMLEAHNLYAYPSGRILVAYCSEAERTQVLRRHGFPKSYWGGIVNRAQFDGEIARVRSAGVLERYHGGVASFAAAACYADGSLAGSVGVYLPEFRLTAEKKALICEKLRTFGPL